MTSLARFHPSRPRRGATYGERKIFEQLRDLDDSWMVLHSLAFTWRTKGRTRLGESDFVLLHPHHGVLVLEVKDARYRVEGRQWYRQPNDRDEEAVESPFVQAVQNRYKITGLLADLAGISRVPIGHCVVFTAGQPSGNLGPDAPSPIVLSGASFADSPRAILDVVKHWGTDTWRRPTDFRAAVDALSPDALIGPTLDYNVDVSLGDLDRLTNQQFALSTRQLEAVKATSDEARSLILGAAGTGKTFIAYAYARQLARENKSVAVVGAHKQLRLLTRRKLTAQGITAGDPSDVLRALYSPEQVKPYEGCTVWETTIHLVEEHGPCLDSLIVDEAQSLDEEVTAVLQELVVDGGQTVLLADPYQRDANGTWRPEGHYQQFWLTENCRNTLPIGRLVARVSGVPTPASGASGRMPVLDPDKVPDYDAVVASIRPDLDSLNTFKIVVLTRTEQGATRTHEALQRRGYRASRGIREGRFAVCTVEEFRGCESHAVVYVAEPIGDVDRRTIDYIAVSRACAYLRLVGVAGEWSEFGYLFDQGERK